MTENENTGLVIIKDAKAVTTSLKVAEIFGKRHKNVIQTIEDKIHSAENSAQYQNMFALGSYKDKSGKSNPMYYMNRDGFSFIAFGFTGKRADNFKLDYIQAFNQLEMQANQLSQDSYMISDPVQRATKWIEEEQRRQQLAAENEQLKPMAQIGTQLLSSEQTININRFAKILQSNGVDTGRNRLFSWLRSNGYLIASGIDYNLPTAYAMQLGLFEVEEKPYMVHGETQLGRTTKVTTKGQAYFLKKLTKEADQAA